MLENTVIRLETEKDYREVEFLTREAFWNGYRPGCSEHYILHRFRSLPEFIPEPCIMTFSENNAGYHALFPQSHCETPTVVK